MCCFNIFKPFVEEKHIIGQKNYYVTLTGVQIRLALIYAIGPCFALPACSMLLFIVSDLHNCFIQRTNVKVTMNKLCARLFIIIFMTYTRKSECIPTVTNFASILANYFYFLRKITAQRPSVLNFRGRLVKFCQKSSGQTVRKWLFRSWFTKNATQNFM